MRCNPRWRPRRECESSTEGLEWVGLRLSSECGPNLITPPKRELATGFSLHMRFITGTQNNTVVRNTVNVYSCGGLRSSY